MGFKNLTGVSSESPSRKQDGIEEHCEVPGQARKRKTVLVGTSVEELPLVYEGHN